MKLIFRLAVISKHLPIHNTILTSLKKLFLPSFSRTCLQVMATAAIAREQSSAAHSSHSLLEKLPNGAQHLGSAATRPSLSSVSRVNSFRSNVSLSSTNAAAMLSKRSASPQRSLSCSPARANDVRVELRNLNSSAQLHNNNKICM